MSWLLPAIVVLVIFAVLAVLKAARKAGTVGANYSYIQAGPLFTPAERSFLGVLQTAVGEDAQVFGKVRVADVIKPPKGLSRSEWQKAFNRISAKHFDFIVCKAGDLSVVCAVELNDRSHHTKKRQQRDNFLAEACHGANVPLIQVTAKSGYVVADIRALVAPYLDRELSPDLESNASTPVEVPRGKACPKCSSPMVRRTATRGKHAGNEFIGCSAYPKCRHLEPINSA